MINVLHRIPFQEELHDHFHKIERNEGLMLLLESR